MPNRSAGFQCIFHCWKPRLGFGVGVIAFQLQMSNFRATAGEPEQLTVQTSARRDLMYLQIRLRGTCSVEPAPQVAIHTLPGAAGTKDAESRHSADKSAHACTLVTSTRLMLLNSHHGKAFTAGEAASPPKEATMFVKCNICLNDSTARCFNLTFCLLARCQYNTQRGQF